MTASQDVPGWMDSLACLVPRVTASKALQGMQVSLAYLEPRAFQETLVLQGRAYQAQKAIVVFLETLGYLDLRDSLVPQVPQGPQDREIVTRV